MLDLNAPLGNCITPPCYTLGQILEGLGLLVAVLLILVVILTVLTMVLGGKVVGAAPEYASSSGAYGLGRWATTIVERLPRPWRDEAFYEELQADRSTVGKAAVAVAMAALVVMAPSALGETIAGKALDAMQRLVVGVISGLAIWVALSTVAAGVARFVFGRRRRWAPVLAGLGFALSSLVLLALSGVPFVGIIVVIVAISWALGLCYVAIRGTVQGDEVQTLGVTLSILLATFGLWVIAQTTCVFCAGFTLTGCPPSNPVKGVRASDGTKSIYLPSTPGYEQISAERCFSGTLAAENWQRSP
jgi:Yip1 domain